MNFKDWLVKEGGKGSGTKISITGLRSGGNLQGGRRFIPAKPHINPVKHPLSTIHK